MNWYNSSDYEKEKDSIIQSITIAAKQSNPEVEISYSKPYSDSEVKQVLDCYLDYSMQTNTFIQTVQEKTWLADPFIRAIMTKMYNGDVAYSYAKKGTRDRIWVYLAVLNKLYKDNALLVKWLKPYTFAPNTPDSYNEQKEDKQDNKMLIVGAIAGLAVITKYFDLW